MSSENGSTELAVGKLLEQYRSQFESALPRHVRIDHFQRCALTYIKKNPEVGKCTPLSVVKALMDAAQLGLAPDGLLGSAYLVPFNNKVKDGGREYYEKQCQLIPGYRGLIELARRSGEILDIQARPVLIGDEFSLDWGKPHPLSHKPNLDANPAEANGANVRGVYAIAFYKDGSQHLEYMSRLEIVGIQNRSQANKKGFSPWQSDWVEMARKTVVKRLAKYLPLSPEFMHAIELDNNAAEVVRDAEVVDDESKPATKTESLKNRLAHKHATPVNEELDETRAQRESQETVSAPNGDNGQQGAPVKQESATAVAEPELVADELTTKHEVTIKRIGSKPHKKRVGDMDDSELTEALDYASASLRDAQDDRARSYQMGVVNLVTAEMQRRNKG